MTRNRTVLLIALLGLLIMTACQGEPLTPTLTPTLTPAPTETVAPTATATDAPTPEPTVKPTEPAVEKVSGVPYVDGGDTHQSSDIYFMPGRETAYPTLLVLLNGLNGMYVAPQAKELARLGYAVVVADQRYPGVANYRPRVEDSFCALGWLYAHAETYHFDLERIAVMTYGVNGVIAVQMGLGEDSTRYLENCAYQLPEAPWLHGIIVQTGVFDFMDLSEMPWMATGVEEKYLGVSYDENPDLWMEASVQQRVNSNLPSHLLITPEDFETVPQSVSEGYAAALGEVDVDATVVVVPDADFMSLLVHPKVTEAIQAFMDEL